MVLKITADRLGRMVAMQITEREKALEGALLEYVQRFGLTEKARDVLSAPLRERPLKHGLRY